MRKINPKCSDFISFVTSIIIPLHYYELLPHPERYCKFKKYLGTYEAAGNSPEGFEFCNPTIAITVYNENGEIIHILKNNSHNKAHMVKINNTRYNAIKPEMKKKLKMKNMPSSFSQKELSEIFKENISEKLVTN